LGRAAAVARGLQRPFLWAGDIRHGIAVLVCRKGSPVERQRALAKTLNPVNCPGQRHRDRTEFVGPNGRRNLEIDDLGSRVLNRDSAICISDRRILSLLTGIWCVVIRGQVKSSAFPNSIRDFKAVRMGDGIGNLQGKRLLVSSWQEYLASPIS